MATYFLDGPAQGKSLNLRRLPHFLRVVISADGTVDALDQLDDVCASSETPHVYRMEGSVGRAIFCSRGHGCRTEEIADYRYHDQQPEESVLRDNDAWAEWATKEYTNLHDRGL